MEVSGLIALPLSHYRPRSQQSQSGSGRNLRSWWIWAIGGVQTYCATPIAYLEVSGLIEVENLIDNFCWWIWAIGGVRTYCATPSAYLEVSGLIVLEDLIDNFCWWIWAIGGVRNYCATPIELSTQITTITRRIWTELTKLVDMGDWRCQDLLCYPYRTIDPGVSGLIALHLSIIWRCPDLLCWWI